MAILFNPNANLVTIDFAAHATPLAATINGCTALNTIFLGFAWIDQGSTVGLSPPAAPAGFVIDASINSLGVSGQSAISAVLYRAASVAAGSHAISLPFTGIGSAPYYWEGALFETTPVTLDKAPAPVFNNTTSVTGPNTGILSNAVELAIALCGADSSVTTPGIPSLPTGFTSIFGGNASGTGISGRIAQQITVNGAALNPSWTSTSADAMAALVATYADASLGPQPGRPKRRGRQGGLTMGLNIAEWF